MSRVNFDWRGRADDQSTREDYFAAARHAPYITIHREFYAKAEMSAPENRFHLLVHRVLHLSLLGLFVVKGYRLLVDLRQDPRAVSVF